MQIPELGLDQQLYVDAIGGGEQHHYGFFFRLPACVNPKAASVVPAGILRMASTMKAAQVVAPQQIEIVETAVPEPARVGEGGLLIQSELSELRK